MVKHLGRSRLQRNFALFKRRLLRVFKAYLFRKFFAKWSLVRFIKAFKHCKPMVKRRLLIWVYRHSEGSSIKDIKWRFFFKLVNNKLFFKFVFYNRLFFRFVRRRSALYFLFLCIYYAKDFLQIKRFKKIFSLSLLRKKNLLKFSFRKSFRRFPILLSDKFLLRRRNSSSLVSFLRKKETIFGKKLAFFNREAANKARDTLKLHQKVVYRRYKGRLNRRERGYMLGCAKRFFSKSLRFIKSSHKRREAFFKGKLSSFFARKLVARGSFVGFYSFYFFSSFSFIFNSFPSFFFFSCSLCFMVL